MRNHLNQKNKEDNKIADINLTNKQELNLSDENTKSISNLDRVINLLSILLPLQISMDRLVDIEKRYQKLLYEPELLFEYRKDWIALLIAIRLYNNYRTLKMLKAENVKRNIEQIKVYDNDLAENIEKIFPLVEKETGIFSDLLDALLNGKDYFVNYISTHLTELITRAKSIKDEKLSKQFVTLFSSISGHEVEYLVRYRNDVDNWTSYIVGNDIYFFMNRINLYLKGGFENNTRFMGLYKDFGDVELTTTMLKDPAIRNLWRFNEQMNYLKVLINLCKKSETSGKWEGFFGKDGFWGKEGDAKGKNFDRYAKEFETKYGNKDFADILKAQKWQIGESPEGWGGKWRGNVIVEYGFLQKELLLKLQHPNYQRQKTILPAASALHKILQAREDELKAKRDEFVDQLIRLLQEAEGIGIAREKVIKKFARLLEKQKKLQLKDLDKDIIDLISKSSGVLLEYDTYVKQQEKVMEKLDFWYIYDKTVRLAALVRSHSEYEIRQLIRGQFLRNFRELVRTTISDSLAKEALIRKEQYEEFEHLNEEDFVEIQKLIPQARDIIRNLVKVYGYIKFKLIQKFVIRIEEIESLRLDSNKTKNRNFEFIYIKDALNRII